MSRFQFPEKYFPVWTAVVSATKIGERSVLNSLQPMITFSGVFGFLPLFLFRRSAENEPILKWKRLSRIAYVIFVTFTIHLLAVINFAEYLLPNQTSTCADVSCYMRKYIGFSFNMCCVIYSLYFSTVGLKKFWNIVQCWDDIGRRFYTCFNISNTSVVHFVMPKVACFRFVFFYYGIVIFEHVMQDIWLIHTYVQNYKSNKVTVSFFYSLFNDTYPLTYVILHYVPGSEFWLYLGGKYKVIAWNYADFVIIAIGLNLNCSLSAFSRQLKYINSKHQWKKARKMHLQLCELVVSIDDLLAPIILITLFVSIYFICNQIYFQFQQVAESSMLRTLYGSMSILLLSLRAGGTILVSAQINENGKSVLKALRVCPTYLYDIEVERFWNQVVDYPLAFTGAKLFLLNRKFFLTTVSVIVTYELVFLGLI